jgi:predicted DNA-binding mobile mystery protein A
MNTQRLALRQVEDRLKPWRALPREVPAGGWIQTIRKALGMSGRQLAGRLGVTRQALAFLEQREAEGTISLAALSRAADSLECDLVYALVPRTPLGAYVEAEARTRAMAEVNRVAHSMHLEEQASTADEVEHLITERTASLVADPGSLWELEYRAASPDAHRPRPARKRGRPAR